MVSMKKFLQITAITFGTLFLAFFVYANWAPPTAGERIYMSNPTGITAIDVPANYTAQDIQAFSDELNHTEGVTSFTHSPNLHMFAVTYSKKETCEKNILSQLKDKGFNASKKVIESNKPQCPVHGYLDAFYKAKYALNIRK